MFTRPTPDTRTRAFGVAAWLLLLTSCPEQTPSAAQPARMTRLAATPGSVYSIAHRLAAWPHPELATRSPVEREASPSPLQTVARAHVRQAQACWEASLAHRERTTPTIAKVVLSFDVSAQGVVENVTVTTEPDGYPQLAPCLVRELRAWRLPASAGYRVGGLPFVFSSS